MTLPVRAPGGGDGGGVVVGSGKLGSPCSRTQRATASSRSLSVSSEEPEALPPGISPAQAFCADRNAGAAVSMLDGMFGSRPSGSGSGKSGTPCARRHLTYVSASPAFDGVVLAGRADPHAAIAAAPATAKSVSAVLWAVRVTARVVRDGTQHGPNGRG